MTSTFLVNTITAWDEPPRARHQFTYAMAKKHEVIFVTRNKVGRKNLHVSNPQKNITLIEPSYPIDYRFRYRLPIINEIYQKWLFKKLKKMYPTVPVVNFDFTARKLVDYYKDYVYYCHDEYAGNSKYASKLIDNYILKCERKVASQAKFCVTTSRYLTNKLLAFNKNTHEIQLGVSIPIDSAVSIEKKNKTEDIVVGLMGWINERHVSIEIVNRVLEDGRFRLHLIGPTEKPFLNKLNKSDKLKITGVLKGTELVDALRKIDVGVALYNLGRKNPGCTPNKVWQYLSLGKPSVVSDLPNLKSMTFPENSVYVLKDEKNVIGQLLKAYNENTEDLAKSRIEFAKKNTWDDRIETFLAHFGKHF